jgi:PAS domain S-box-containing protein
VLPRGRAWRPAASGEQRRAVMGAQTDILIVDNDRDHAFAIIQAPKFDVAVLDALATKVGQTDLVDAAKNTEPRPQVIAMEDLEALAVKKDVPGRGARTSLFSGGTGSVFLDWFPADRYGKTLRSVEVRVGLSLLLFLASERLMKKGGSTTGGPSPQARGESAGRGIHDGEPDEFSVTSRKVGSVALAVLLLVGLYVASEYNYLLFHTVVEVFSVVVACTFFFIAWNARRMMDNNYLLFLSIAYFFVAGFDLIHAVTYKGMGVVPTGGANLPTQLWIAARYLQSGSILAAPLFMGRELRAYRVLGAFTVISALILASIFWWQVFPECYVEGVGLTAFKKISEYVICIMLVAGLLLLVRIRRHFDRRVFLLLAVSFVLTIGSELAFTFYVSVYGFSNLIGHYFKLIAFYALYKAVIETGLRKPYNLLFRELNREKDALRESEEKYRVLYQRTPALLYSVDQVGRIEGVNDYCLETLGYDRAEVLGRNILDFLRGESPEPAVAIHLPELFQSGQARDVPVQVLKKSGGRIDTLMSAVAQTGTKGQRIQYLAVLTDITDRKIAERQIEESLREKEVLLREVHHRVKNNLNVIHSLLSLQSDYAADEFHRQMFEETQARVRSMAEAHERLYRSESLATLDIDDYVGSLVDHLVGESPATGGRIHLNREIVDVSFGLDTAIPLGMIVNELVSNCLKHAFPDERNGEIGISIRRMDEDEFELKVRDDGAGISKEINLDAPDSLGLDLVDAFVKMLHGRIEISANGGTTVLIRFKELHRS